MSNTQLSKSFSSFWQTTKAVPIRKQTNDFLKENQSETWLELQKSLSLKAKEKWKKN